jgi:hypothetical protein
VVEHRSARFGDAQARARRASGVAADRRGARGCRLERAAGRPIDAAISHARYSDIAILGQPLPADDHAGFANDLVRSVLMAAGRPVLIVRTSAKFASIGATVLIAWKETRESARAVGRALPFLRAGRARSSSVSISAPR